MTLCLAAGGKVLALAVTGFTLSWTHSVEHEQWWERWEVTAEGIRPVEARVLGSGAGMEAPPDAVWQKDGWHYRPHLPPQKEVFLGASGMTGDGWHLCAAGTCRDIGRVAEKPLHLWQSDHCE